MPCIRVFAALSKIGQNHPHTFVIIILRIRHKRRRGDQQVRHRCAVRLYRSVAQFQPHAGFGDLVGFQNLSNTPLDLFVRIAVENRQRLGTVIKPLHVVGQAKDLAADRPHGFKQSDAVQITAVGNGNSRRVSLDDLSV